MRTIAAIALLLCACRGGNTTHAYRPPTGGNAARGAKWIRAYGCGACHIVPGIRGADGVVAPPLTQFARRTFIAGEVANTPGNLVRWIRKPQHIEPRTAMPALGVTEQQARDIAAYLYELE